MRAQGSEITSQGHNDENDLKKVANKNYNQGTNEICIGSSMNKRHC